MISHMTDAGLGLSNHQLTRGCQSSHAVTFTVTVCQAGVDEGASSEGVEWRMKLERTAIWSLAGDDPRHNNCQPTNVEN